MDTNWREERPSQIPFKAHQIDDHTCLRNYWNGIKEEFYSRLQDVLDRRNVHDMLIITGDMNAEVWRAKREL